MAMPASSPFGNDDGGNAFAFSCGGADTDRYYGDGGEAVRSRTKDILT